MTQNAIFAVVAALGLSACAAPGPTIESPDVARLIESKELTSNPTPPAAAETNACYGVDASPAEVRTVIDYYSSRTPEPNSVMLEPAEYAPDGTMLYPPVYKRIRQEISKEREDLWLETPCANALTPDSVASLQRALNARGYYDGPADGRLTEQTRDAIRSYQQTLGLDSAVLSIEAARQLGLTAYPVNDPES